MNLRLLARARFVLLAVTAVAAVVLTAAPSNAMLAHARRHLKLLKTSPTADAVLTKSPDAVRLWLSEPAEVPATKITLTTAAGAAIATAAVTHAASKDAPLVALIPTQLASGAYKVTWKAMSKDGHVVKGTFGFKIGAAK